MFLEPILGELKDLKKFEKALISKQILFNKIAAMRRKSKFFKSKGRICNIPIEAANKCNTLTRPAFSNGLITVKLKRDLKYRVHVLRIHIARFIF